MFLASRHISRTIFLCLCPAVTDKMSVSDGEGRLRGACQLPPAQIQNPNSLLIRHWCSVDPGPGTCSSAPAILRWGRTDSHKQLCEQANNGYTWPDIEHNSVRRFEISYKLSVYLNRRTVERGPEALVTTHQSSLIFNIYENGMDKYRISSTFM